MSDLISRQAAIDAIDSIGSLDTDADREYARGIFNALPSAQPEFIRCRDCNHWDKTWTNDWSPDYHYCPMIDGVRKGDFYCADAERRTVQPEHEYTMEEFMYGQDMGNPEDGSL